MQTTQKKFQKTVIITLTRPQAKIISTIYNSNPNGNQIPTTKPFIKHRNATVYAGQI